MIRPWRGPAQRLTQRLALHGSLAWCTLACEEAVVLSDVVGDPLFVDGLPATRGIRLVDVTVNQAVEDSLAAPSRVSIAGRDALVRAKVELEDDWQPRIVEARLLLRSAVGEETVLTARAFVTTDDEPDFSWPIEGRYVQPGTSVAAALIEVDASFVDAWGEHDAARWPQSGTVAWSIDDSLRRLEIVLVPIRHRVPEMDCPPVVVIDEARRQRFADRLRARFPVTDVHVDVHEVVDLDEPTGGGLGVPVDTIVALRSFEAPAPAVFYVGVIDLCDDVAGREPAGLAAGFGDDTMASAYKRAMVVTEAGAPGPDEVVAHELGHGLGRRHTPCGDPPVIDKDYPHDNGQIGVIGWGEGQRWSADTPDLMSYCHPRWVSAYGWDFVAPVIETLSSWSVDGRRGSPPRIEGRRPIDRWAVFGSEDADGRRIWWAPAPEGAAVRDGPSSGERVRVIAIDGSELEVTLRPETAPHGRTSYLGVLPADVVPARVTAVSSEPAWHVLEPPRVRGRSWP